MHRYRNYFLTVQASCVLSTRCHKGPWQNQTEPARSKMADKVGWWSPFSLTWFISVFPYQPLRAEGHLPWFISVFVSKVPGVGPMICSCTGRDTCFERYTVVNCSEPSPDLTTGPHLCRWNLEESKSYLCFIIMLRSLPNGGICTLLAQLVPCAKECGRPRMPGLPLEISTPFLVPWWPVCLLTLKIPLLPSLRGDGAFRAWAPLLHSLAIE